MTTAIWTTAPIPAHWLAAGDRIVHDGRTLTLIEVSDQIGFVTVVGEDPDVYVVESFNAYATISVHVPDIPVDGYNLFRPPPGFWPWSGCTCVHRDDGDGNWVKLCTDPQCGGCRADLDDD